MNKPIYRVRKDPTANKWYLQRKECVDIGKLRWVIVSIHESEKGARKALEAASP